MPRKQTKKRASAASAKKKTVQTPAEPANQPPATPPSEAVSQPTLPPPLLSGKPSETHEALKVVLDRSDPDAPLANGISSLDPPLPALQPQPRRFGKKPEWLPYQDRLLASLARELKPFDRGSSAKWAEISTRLNLELESSPAPNQLKTTPDSCKRRLEKLLKFHKVFSVIYITRCSTLY